MTGSVEKLTIYPNSIGKTPFLPRQNIEGGWLLGHPELNLGSEIHYLVQFLLTQSDNPAYIRMPKFITKAIEEKRFRRNTWDYLVEESREVAQALRVKIESLFPSEKFSVSLYPEVLFAPSPEQVKKVRGLSNDNRDGNYNDRIIGLLTAENPEKIMELIVSSGISEQMLAVCTYYLFHFRRTVRGKQRFVANASSRIDYLGFACKKDNSGARELIDKFGELTNGVICGKRPLHDLAPLGDNINLLIALLDLIEKGEITPLFIELKTKLAANQMRDGISHKVVLEDTPPEEHYLDVAHGLFSIYELIRVVLGTSVNGLDGKKAFSYSHLKKLIPILKKTKILLARGHIPVIHYNQEGRREFRVNGAVSRSDIKVLDYKILTRKMFGIGERLLERLE